MTEPPSDETYGLARNSTAEGYRLGQAQIKELREEPAGTDQAWTRLALISASSISESAKNFTAQFRTPKRPYSPWIG